MSDDAANRFKIGVIGMIDMLIKLLACEDEDILASAAKMSLMIRMTLSKLERIAGVTEPDLVRARAAVDQAVMAAKERILAKGGKIDPDCEVP